MSTPPKEPGSSARPLVRGRHGLPRAVVVENQRERIFDALKLVCASKGYAEMTVEDIIARAGVSRRTFYDLFDDKEQCFLDAYDQIVSRLFDEVRRAYSAGEGPWPDRIAAGLEALVQVCASDPELARVAVVDVLAAGQPALERRNAALRAFAAFFEPGTAILPADMAGTDLLAQAVVGGLYEVLYSHVADGRTTCLPRIVPDFVYCALVPYVGHAQAATARDAARERRGEP
jgi:AcrR family transcriptional regulator